MCRKLMCMAWGKSNEFPRTGWETNTNTSLFPNLLAYNLQTVWAPEKWVMCQTLNAFHSTSSLCTLREYELPAWYTFPLDVTEPAQVGNGRRAQVTLISSSRWIWSRFNIQLFYVHVGKSQHNGKCFSLPSAFPTKPLRTEDASLEMLVLRNSSHISP